MDFINKFEDFCLEKYWSGKVTKKVKKSEKPKEGIFTKEAEDIVKELLDKSENNIGTAIKKLQFYINRAGEKLHNKTEILKAKKILQDKLDKKD